MFTIIIVDFNSLDKTIEYVLDCKENLGVRGASHVVIVENGNFEGTLETLTSAFGEYMTCVLPNIEQKTYKFTNSEQEIYYCCSGENMGYARGNNLGVLIAQSVWNDPYYIISNNDLEFNKELDLLLVEKSFIENPSVGVIGPAIITPDGQSQSPRRWQSAFRRLILNYWIPAISGLFGKKLREKIFNSYTNDTIIGAESGPCAWVSGCFLFVRSESFKQCNMFDEQTFLYAEEMILSKRMEKAGYHEYYLSELQVIHHHAVTTKKTLAAFKMMEIDFHSNHYFYKNYTDTSSFVLFLSKISFNLYKLCFKFKGFLSRR